MTKLYGSIEAGGTKFVCAVGDEELKVVEKMQFPTTTPQETIKKTVDFFKRFEKKLEAVAIGSFGPIDIDKKSKTYGYITTTPKLHWANVDLLGLISKDFNVPFYFTTDVNSSAYGEVIARNNIDSLVYYTIGTGIGAGAIQKGEFIGGTGHTEAGHTYMAMHPQDQANDFKGICPFHNSCLEGLASGPTLEARTGIRGELIEENSMVWDVQAYYIAQAAMQATVLYRPQVIVFGGGVMAQEHMLRRVRQTFATLLNGYLPVPDLSDYICDTSYRRKWFCNVRKFCFSKENIKRLIKPLSHYLV